jgi:NAD-dependent dihydropyrimidine dehydrogenase PreA subunit
MKRDILKIDEEKCTGCGLCVPNCHEEALQVIDNKVRLVSELMCDGLGACIGYCPEGAITIETREAEPYDEIKVMERMKDKGKNTVTAHLKHLKDHGETRLLRDGVGYLMKHLDTLTFDLDEVMAEVHNHGKQAGMGQAEGGLQTLKAAQGCPGSAERIIEKPLAAAIIPETSGSELRQWPVQMHLINPNASYFHGADLLLAADCVAYSTGAFHQKYLRGKSLAIACPKLDRDTEIYVEKISTLIDAAKVNTITVMVMEVPCCGGLMHMVKTALSKASRKVPVKKVMISVSGEVLSDEWV